MWINFIFGMGCGVIIYFILEWTLTLYKNTKASIEIKKILIKEQEKQDKRDVEFTARLVALERKLNK